MASETSAARALVASCPACAELHADLVSIMAATTALPAPRRTRDFRLTEADAARLRPRGWRRFIGAFGGPRLAFTRPLAGSLVALGVAGLVLASIPGFFGSTSSESGSGTLAPAAAAPAGSGLGGTGFGAAVKQPAASGGENDAALASPVQAVPAASAAPASAGPSDGRTVAGIGEGAVPTAGPAAPAATTVAPSAAANVAPSAATTGPPPAATTSSTPAFPLLAASIVLVALGLGLFALRWMAGRPA